MLHILTIAVRQIMYAIALPMRNSQIVQQNYLSKKNRISHPEVSGKGVRKICSKLIGGHP